MNRVPRAWALAAAAALGACTTTSPDVVLPPDAQVLSTVHEATVVSVRPVTVEGSQSGLGATAGGIAIGALSSANTSGNEAVALGMLGAVVGAVAGNAIERAATRESAVELLLELPNGERRALVQAQGADVFRAGDRVTLVTSGGRTRVTKTAPGTPPAAPAPATTPPEPVYSPGGRGKPTEAVPPSSGRRDLPGPLFAPGGRSRATG